MSENYESIYALIKRIEKLEGKLKEVAGKVSDFQINQSVLAGRIFDLEEKERERQRKEHNLELSLDERREGQDRDQFMFEGL